MGWVKRWEQESDRICHRKKGKIFEVLEKNTSAHMVNKDDRKKESRCGRPDIAYPP